MSLSSATQKVQYSPNGATTVFSVPFYFQSNSDLVVILTDSTGADTTKVITTDYTVSGAGSPPSGSVTMLSTPASGTRLTIKRVVALTQLIAYVNNDNFPSATTEQALDRLTMICQHLLEITSRCLQIPSGEASTRVVIFPKVDTRKSKAVAFDANGDITVQ